MTDRFDIIQKRRGHRAAVDDTLLAWAAACARPEAVRVLDLGSGKGTVAMLLLQRLPDCAVVGVEAEPISHDLALRNRSLNGLGERWMPRLGDLREPSVLAEEEPFDLITGAPPFMEPGAGTLPKDPIRAAARFELRGGVVDYVKTAVRHLAPSGVVVILMDDLGLDRARSAFKAEGLGLRRLVTVRPCRGRQPTYRILVGGRGDGELVQTTLDLRTAPGADFSPCYNDIRRQMNLT